MKILIVTPSIPYPPYRGDKLRLYNIINILSRNNEITIVTFIKDKNDYTFAEELKKKGIRVHFIKIPIIKSLIKYIRFFFSKLPLQVLSCQNKKMKEKINFLTKENNYDIVYFHIFTTAQYYTAISNPDTLKVLDLTDAVSLYLTRFLEFVKNPLKKIYFNIEKKRVSKYENIASKFDVTFVCSHVDKEYLERKKIDSNFKLFVNGIDKDKFSYRYEKTEKYRIIFTGNMPYFPNRDAVKFFINEIFPIVLKKYPEAKLYIVGKDPTEDIKKMASENVIIKGFVEDLITEYLISEVNIAPIRFGAGTPNKIIEALALGIPTVATSLAVNGFNEEIKKYIFIADSPADFADKIINIFNNINIRTTYMRDVSSRIVDTLNTETIISDIEAYLIERVKMKREQYFKSQL